MTNDEIATMSRAVAQHFGLWTTPRPCPFSPKSKTADTHGIFCELHQEHFYHEIEIPCPDLTQQEWFVRLLNALPIGIELYNRILRLGPRYAKQWAVDYFERRICVADTPEEALLHAAYELVQREAAK